MFRLLAAVNRPHFKMIAQMGARDITTLLAAISAVCALTYAVGHPFIACCVALWAIMAELLCVRMFKKQSPFTTLTSDQILTIALITGILNTVIYTIPAVVLAQNGSVAIKVIAILWIICLQIHVSNSWSRIPVFLYTRLIPTLVVMVFVVFKMSSTSPVPSSQLEWSAALAAVFGLIYISIETLRHQVSNDLALNKAERQASKQANQLEDAQRVDSVSGAMHRATFDNALSIMLEEHDVSSGKIGVFLIRLDNFRAINTTYGYEIGDHVLKTIAERLQQTIDVFGVVGRMSGDEFICAVPELSDTDAVETLAQDMENVIARAIHRYDLKIKLHTSIGLSMTGGTPTTVRSLCSEADQAMQFARTTLAGGPVLYHSQQFEPQLPRHHRKALIETVLAGELAPRYRPIHNLETGEITGFDTVLNWTTPDGVLLHWFDILPYIREFGICGPLVSSLLRQIVKDLQTLHKLNQKKLRVSLHLALDSLATPYWRDDIMSALKSAPEICQSLTFNLCNDVLKDCALDTLEASISDYRSLGVRIGIDDFGGHFASIQQLRHLRFDSLRLDASHANDGRGQHALFRGMFDLARGFQATVTAKEMTSQRQQMMFLAMGCETGSGPLFNQAVPFEQALDILQNQTAAISA